MAQWWDIPYGVDGTTGPDGAQFLRLHAAPPEAAVSETGPHGTVVVIHGGYWKNQYGLDDEYGNAASGSLAPFFLRSGFSAVELEYRRRDHQGGGWPGTNEDILRALQRLGDLEQPEDDPRLAAAVRALRPDRLVLVGHSAGGQLALWAAHQMTVGCTSTGLTDTVSVAADSGVPSSRKHDRLLEAGGDERAGLHAGQVRVALVLAVAPVADLVRGHELRISDEGDAVERYMGFPPDSETRLQEYRKASPSALLPVTFPLLIAYGAQDADVPPALVAGYAEAATASSPKLVSVLEVPDADHYAVVSANSSAWLEHILPALAVSASTHLSEAASHALLRAGSASS